VSLLFFEGKKFDAYGEIQEGEFKEGELNG